MRLETSIARLGLAVLPASAAPGAKASAAIRAQCAARHANNGIATATNMPNLAGQNYQYLLTQLEAYKKGTRTNPLMNEMAKPISRRQMQDLSACFASIPIRGGPVATK